MREDLAALLALQDDDLAIHELETQVAALEPRQRQLDAERQRAAEALDRAEQAVAAEEKRQAWLRDKIAEHKALIDKNQQAMDQVKTLRAATAAATQMEQARRVVAGEESDLLALNRKLEELRGVVASAKATLTATEEAQAQARGEMATERARLDGELAVARERRAPKAGAVPAPLLGKYERIRGKRRVQAVWAMRGMSCGACDTAIPLQRRHTMANTGAIELCEACGVLMYFTGTEG